MEPLTRAWLEIDLAALRRNALRMAERARAPLLLMVKADAYGLGAVPVARALETVRPWGYGVASIAEGAELREAGVARPVMVFTPLLPGDFAGARAHRLTPTLGDHDAIDRWVRTGGGAWHLAIDTGMSRAGIRWDHVETLAPLVSAHPPEGAFTHFHSADKCDGTMEAQLECFRAAVAALPVRPALLHVANSPALERGDAHGWDIARPGVFLYGVGAADGATVAPEPVVSLRARVVEVRDVHDGETVSYDATYRAVGRRRIATVNAGYADGYRRALSNRGVALVRGRRAPVAGLVTMDMLMLDVTDLPCDVGDVVTLIGRDGDEEIDLGDASRLAEMSPYEILVGLALRAARTYHDDPP